MSLTWKDLDENARRFPRVSGDEPYLTSFMLGLREFSPRERG